MIIEFCDYNQVNRIINEQYDSEWDELKEVLEAMPLYLKESDQAGIQGSPIFDVVGTNSYIRDCLLARNWRSHISIPDEYKFMGTDVDFGKKGLIVEAQFSNYPFLSS